MSADKNESEREPIPLVDSAYFRISTGKVSAHTNSDDANHELETTVRTNDHSSARPGLDLEDDAELDYEHYVSFHVKSTDHAVEEASVQMDLEPNHAVKLGRKLMSKGIETRKRNKQMDEKDESEKVQFNQIHNTISVYKESGGHEKICSCEITDEDINDDGTVSFPLTEPGCSKRD